MRFYIYICVYMCVYMYICIHGNMCCEENPKVDVQGKSYKGGKEIRLVTGIWTLKFCIRELSQI
jgi:hypothetical protein